MFDREFWDIDKASPGTSVLFKIVLSKHFLTFYVTLNLLCFLHGPYLDFSLLFLRLLWIFWFFLNEYIFLSNSWNCFLHSYEGGGWRKGGGFLLKQIYMVYVHFLAALFLTKLVGHWGGWVSFYKQWINQLMCSLCSDFNIMENVENPYSACFTLSIPVA